MDTGVLDKDDLQDLPTLQPSNPPVSPFSRLLLGIGNDLHGDDGVGPVLARSFETPPGWLAVDAGAAPENFTSLIRRHHPKLLVIVDAADLNLPPGEFRRVPPEMIRNVGLGTHQVPLYYFIRYLEDAADRIVFIGVQPAFLGEESRLSPEVERAVLRLARILRDDGLDQVPAL